MITDKVSIARARYYLDGIAAKEATDSILKLSSEHIAAWWAIKAGLVTTRKTGDVSITMMSKILLWPMAKCEAILNDIKQVILTFYGLP